MGIDRERIRLRSFNRKRDRLGPDLCSLVTSVSAPDGFGGSTETLTTILDDIPCFYEVLGNPMQRQIGGGPITTLTHKITMEATAETKAIRPDYQIVVEARNDKPELTFENPVTLDGSFTPLVSVAAVLSE